MKVQVKAQINAQFQNPRGVNLIVLAIYLWSNQLWLWVGSQNKYIIRGPALVRRGRGGRTGRKKERKEGEKEVWFSENRGS